MRKRPWGRLVSASRNQRRPLSPWPASWGWLPPGGRATLGWTPEATQVACFISPAVVFRPRFPRRTAVPVPAHRRASLGYLDTLGFAGGLRRLSCVVLRMVRAAGEGDYGRAGPRADNLNSAQKRVFPWFAGLLILARSVSKAFEILSRVKP